MHDVAGLIVLLHPKYEDVEDAADNLLILTSIESLLLAGLLTQQVNPQITVCRLKAQTLLAEGLLLDVTTA